MRSAGLLTVSASLLCLGSAIHVKAPGLDAEGEPASAHRPEDLRSELLGQGELLARMLDGLWSGADDAAAPAKKLHHKGQGAKDAAHSSPPKVSRLQVVGPFNSGTNLLSKLLSLNIPEEVMDTACPVLKRKVDSCIFWKHTPPAALPSEVQAMFVEGWQSHMMVNVKAPPKTWPPKDPKRDVVLVAMVRSPMGFMQGMSKAPYDMRHCLYRNDWRNYTETVCHLRKIVDTHEDGYSYEFHGRFAGLTGVWNDYMLAYHALQREAETDQRLKVLLVEYENLVIDPEKVVRRIAQAMGADLKGPFQGLEQMAKHHGSSHGRQKALQSIEHMQYLESWMSPMEAMLGRDARAKVCGHLDAEMMAAHVVNTSNGSRSYLADCDFGR